MAMKLLPAPLHFNGGTIEVYNCSECATSCEQEPVHVSDWDERFCSLQCARDFFHNYNVRRRYAH